MMRRTAVVHSNREVLIQRWQRQLTGRTHIRFQELLHLLRQHVRISSRFAFNHSETKCDLFILSAFVGDTLQPVRSRFKRFAL